MLRLFRFFNANSRQSSANTHTRESRKKLKNKVQAKRNQARETTELQWIKPLCNVKVAVTLSGLIVILALFFISPGDKFLPVEKIRISGQFKQLNTEALQQKLEPYLGQGFFSLDIQSIQQHISADAWIETASVKRIWPNQLQVKVTEKQAVARWDRDHLLSTQAEIFTADSGAFAELPRINGYSGQTVDLLQRYGQMQQAFSLHGIQITEMIEDSKGALGLLLNNDLKVSIGSEDTDTKIKHLLAVYSAQIKPVADHIQHIDFRYSNGFAIAWKNEYLQQSGKLEIRGNKNV